MTLCNGGQDMFHWGSDIQGKKEAGLLTMYISGERAIHAEEIARANSRRWAYAWHVAGVSRKPVFVLPERGMG